MRRRVEALDIGNGGSDVSPVVTVSIGVASGRCSSELSMELWISTADAMLYQGKRSGRNRVEGHVMIQASGAEILGHGERREAG